MRIIGYQINTKTGEKEIFYQDIIGNHRGGSIRGANTANKRNSAYAFIADFIQDVPRGEYYFDIEDVSKNNDYFKEINASIKIIPYAEIH